MNYEPPCINNLPTWLADRVSAQGLSNTIIALTAQVALVAPGGAHPDAGAHTILADYLTKVTDAKNAGQGG